MQVLMIAIVSISTKNCMICDQQRTRPLYPPDLTPGSIPNGMFFEVIRSVPIHIHAVASHLELFSGQWLDDQLGERSACVRSR
jgi:hypothetical protein